MVRANDLERVIFGENAWGEVQSTDAGAEENISMIDGDCEVVQVPLRGNNLMGCYFCLNPFAVSVQWGR